MSRWTEILGVYKKFSTVGNFYNISHLKVIIKFITVPVNNNLYCQVVTFSYVTDVQGAQCVFICPIETVVRRNTGQDNYYVTRGSPRRRYSNECLCQDGNRKGPGGTDPCSKLSQNVLSDPPIRIFWVPCLCVGWWGFTNTNLKVLYSFNTIRPRRSCLPLTLPKIS